MSTTTEVIDKGLDLAQQLAHQLATIASQGVQIGLAAMQATAIITLVQFTVVGVVGICLFRSASAQLAKSKTLGVFLECDRHQALGTGFIIAGSLASTVGFIGVVCGPWLTAINPALGLAQQIINKLL